MQNPNQLKLWGNRKEKQTQNLRQGRPTSITLREIRTLSLVQDLKTGIANQSQGTVNDDESKGKETE
jgi:hypothetical protein